MNKILRNSLYFFIGVLVFGSCSNVDYDGYYSEDGYYEMKPQIYFNYRSTTLTDTASQFRNELPDTTLTYTFGPRLTSISEATIELPIRISGVASANDRYYNVEVVSSGTNAVAGTHYELPSSFVIRANEYKSTLPIKLLRSSLGEENWTLKLRLTNSNDFDASLAKRYEEFVLKFNDIIEKPNFWDSYVQVWIASFGPSFGINDDGHYTKSRYRMMLSYFNGDPDAFIDDINNAASNNYHAWYSVIMPTMQYYMANPSEDI